MGGNAEEYGSCDGVTESAFPMNNGTMVGNDIEVGITHVYTLSMKYLETNVNQSADMNKTFSAKINISNIKQVLASNKNELGILIGDQGNSYYLSKNYKILKNESNIENMEWTTYYVSPNGSDSNTGLTSDSPLRYINTAISQTGDNIKIVLPSGTYHGTVIKGDIDGLSKDIMITSEDGTYTEIYSSKVTSSWTLLDSGVYFWVSSKTSTDVFTKLFKTNDASYYFNKVSSLDELRNSTSDSWYQELNSDGKAVLYVKLSDSSQPTASSLSVVQDSRTLILKNVTPGVNVYFKNIHLENSVISVGQSAVYVSGNDAYKSNYFFEDFKALTLNAYDDSNFYLYDCEFTGKNRGVFFVGNQLVYMENCTSHDTTTDGFSYKTRDNDSGNGLVYEVNSNVYNAGLGSSSYINNASTAHGNWKVIRVGGTYKNAQSRAVHDVNNVISLNMFVTAKTEVGKVAGFESYSFDFAAGTAATCSTNMYLYKCSTKDSLANISLGYDNIQSNSTIFQYMTDYVVKADGVVDWDGNIPDDLSFYVS